MGTKAMGRIVAAGLLLLTACDACSGGKITIKAAPAVHWDGGGDESAHACAVLASASCPLAAGCDTDPNNCACAVAFRNDQAQNTPDHPYAAMVDLGCIIDAGADAAALHKCGVTCQ